MLELLINLFATIFLCGFLLASIAYCYAILTDKPRSKDEQRSRNKRHHLGE
jgi:hypothetical protein